MATFHRFFSASSVLLLLLLLLANSSASTVHEILSKYGLPQGLLPDTVEHYSLSSNGDFVVELRDPCYVHFSTLAYYEKTIKGNLEYGRISGLSGIQVKKLFIWVSVTEIVAHPNDGTVEFEVGFLSQSLPVSEFEAIPTFIQVDRINPFLIYICSDKIPVSITGLSNDTMPYG
ncbi:hypothetical protein J5N97_011007 [Dioscorea zingiberensis]|uniref:Uncharacterized protein n=1 Tax=Dioscorea zingiberensis TaxID=325984 RepID=A0A9D5D1V7_9LILI|nr:hypothetical protein J5N97_011007 [Dioscorea zingiberensis]